GARIDPSPCPTRYAAVYDIDAACASGSAQNTTPEPYGRFNPLWPSTTQESAASRPATRCSNAGLAAAHRPNAPSTWTHAPCRRAASHATRRASNAPRFTFPACPHARPLVRIGLERSDEGVGIDGAVRTGRHDLDGVDPDAKQAERAVDRRV